METLKIYVEDIVYFGDGGTFEGGFVSPYIDFFTRNVILAKAESGWAPSLARSPAFDLTRQTLEAA